MKAILIPIPSYGSDPTEVAIPWQLLSKNDFSVTFATPDGKVAASDKLMLKGEQLGIWKRTLRARQDAVGAYFEMQRDEMFCNPSKYSDVREDRFDALLLPGGHDKGVREYLESEILQRLIADFFVAGKPVAAICHGVVLVARSIDPHTGKSVIHDYQTTALLKSQELLAYNLTRLWLGDYYLTYPEMAVEDEVRSVLSDSRHFQRGPTSFLRDGPDHLERGFVVRDRNYLSARWPGDAYRFTLEFMEMVHDAVSATGEDDVE